MPPNMPPLNPGLTRIIPDSISKSLPDQQRKPPPELKTFCSGEAKISPVAEFQAKKNRPEAVVFDYLALMARG